MNNLIYLFFFAATFCSSLMAATWVPLAKNDVNEYFYDSESIAGVSGDRFLMVKLNSKLVGSDQSKSRLLSYNVNCDENTYILNSIKTYTELDLAGRESEGRLSPNVRREEVKPNSIGQFISKVACDLQNSKMQTYQSDQQNWIKYGQKVNKSSGSSMDVFYGNIKSAGFYRSVEWLYNYFPGANGIKSNKSRELVDCKSSEAIKTSDFSYSDLWAIGNFSKINENEKVPATFAKEDLALYRSICSNNSYPSDDGIVAEWVNVRKIIHERNVEIKNFEQYTCSGTRTEFSYSNVPLGKSDNSIIDFSYHKNQDNLEIQRFFGVLIQIVPSSHQNPLTKPFYSRNNSRIAAGVRGVNGYDINYTFNYDFQTSAIVLTSKSFGVVTTYLGKCKKNYWMGF